MFPSLGEKLSFPAAGYISGLECCVDTVLKGRLLRFQVWKRWDPSWKTYRLNCLGFFFFEVIVSWAAAVWVLLPELDDISSKDDQRAALKAFLNSWLELFKHCVSSRQVSPPALTRSCVLLPTGSTGNKNIWLAILECDRRLHQSTCRFI